MKKIFYLSLVLLCIVFASCSSKSPGAVAKKYMEYVKTGDYEKFADGIVYKEGATTEQKEQGKTMIVALLKEKAAKEIEKKGGIKEIEMVSETIAEDGKTADVILKTTYGDGESQESDCRMVLQDNVWKMDIRK